MTRGRKPDAPELQIAKGNPRKQAKKPAAAAAQSDQSSAATAQSDQSAAPGGAIRPPAKLVGTAVAIWNQLAPDLERMRFLRPTDRMAFARYCDALNRWWQITADLRKEGQTYTSKSAHGDLRRVNPLFLIEERLVRRLEALEDRFGLTPAARQQILVRMAQGNGQLPLSGGSAGPEPETPAQSPVGLLTSTTQH